MEAGRAGNVDYLNAAMDAAKKTAPGVEVLFQ